ncbi:glycosyltransferase family 2 protein, partial [Vibrio owensii]|uniref:glycosyltransferase family 2 protein n=1 Tax=Vibrio owensii TaxID=696485 RepID=UPI003AABD126
GIPILSGNQNLARIEFIRGYGYLFIFNSMFNHMISMMGYLITKDDNHIYNTVFKILIALSFILSFATLFKSAVVVQFLIMFLIMYTFRKKTIDKLNVVMLTTLVMSTLYIMIYLTSYDHSLAFEYLIHRVFMINTFDTVSVINAFHSGSMEFMNGQSIVQDVNANKIGAGMSFQGEMYSYIYDDGLEAGINASYSQMYADFGILGSVIYLIIGFVFELFYIRKFLVKGSIEIDKLVVYGYLCYGMSLSAGYITKGIFNWTLPIIFFGLVYCFLHFINTYKSYKAVMKVSIIMPAYKAGIFIRRSIESVLSQTYTDFELIIINDKSLDNTMDVINSFTDERIKVITNPVNLGVAMTRNEGLKSSTGRFIAFLDSDDIWKPKKLELQVDALMDDQYAICCHTAYERINEHDEKIGQVSAIEKVNHKMLLRGNFIGNLTGVIDTNKIPFKIEQTNVKHEDYLMWLNILKFNDSYYSIGINEPLARYRVHTSVSSNKFKSMYWHWLILRKQLKINLIKSSYYFTAYTYNAIKKRA